MECQDGIILKALDMQNAKYLAMLDKSIAETEAGGFVTKTIAEFEKYE